MKKLSQEEFILECNKIHNFKYDYSDVYYENCMSKIDILCPIHGKFKQRSIAHKGGQGCKKCFHLKNSISQKYTIDDFIKNSIAKHGDTYDYTKSIYVNSRTKIEIICRIHGSFYQIPPNHFKFETPCKQCRKLTKDEILKKFNKKHTNKYDYSLFNYSIDTTTKSSIDIICPNHGVFNQRISHHLNSTGCPSCNESLGEKMICEILTEIGIEFNRQQKFSDMIYENQLLIDFFIPNYNIGIEFDGDQHYKPIGIFGGDVEFEKIKIKDKIKDEYCLNKNIHLFRFNKSHKYNDIMNTILEFIKCF